MTFPTLIAQLAIYGWKPAEAPYDNAFISKDSDLCLDVFDGGDWCLRRFTDSDIETEYGTRAVGRYETIDEGEHLHEVMDAIWCGETRTERQVEEMRRFTK
jgi:hypothetical protein